MSTMQSLSSKNTLNTPVLFLVFNRPETTREVFEAIRQAQPTRLYVAADGPREGREKEKEMVALVRKISTAVDWPCELKTLFQDRNLGCKNAVCAGIDWFFENEEQGIILEDDCLPHADFFPFCEKFLDLYKTNEQIWVITGNNFLDGRRRGEASCYFSRFNHVWGWASWRRSWVKRDMELKFWPEWKKSSSWKAFLNDKFERKYWSKIFDRMYRKEIDTWDYPWTATVWYNNGLTVTPNSNLISNIGFGPGSTHSVSVNSPLSRKKTESLSSFMAPSLIEVDIEADRYVFDNAFGGRAMRFPYVLNGLHRRVAARIIRLFMKLINDPCKKLCNRTNQTSQHDASHL